MFEEWITPLLTTRWGHRTGIAVLATLSLFFSILFIQMIWQWHADWQLDAAPLKQQQVSTTNQLADLINDIPAWHLYGQYGLLAKSAILPVTSLQIKLIGVIKATPNSQSRVIISEENGMGKVYKIGDVLPTSGVRVYAITDEGVILDNSGRLETLPLQRKPLQFQGKPTSMQDE